MADFLLGVLDMDCKGKALYESGRFRDIYLNKDGTGIILYTRNGGGNREAYAAINEALQKHPNYHADYDDDYDETYAYFEFTIPEKYRDQCKKLAKGIEPEKVGEKFQKTIKRMEGMTKEEMEKDPQLGPVGKKLEEALSDETPGVKEIKI